MCRENNNEWYYIFLCLIAVVVLYDQLILQEIAIVKHISVLQYKHTWTI